VLNHFYITLSKELNYKGLTSSIALMQALDMKNDSGKKILNFSPCTSYMRIYTHIYDIYDGVVLKPFCSMLSHTQLILIGNWFSAIDMEMEWAERLMEPSEDSLNVRVGRAKWRKLPLVHRYCYVPQPDLTWYAYQMRLYYLSVR
jgi:hypothetical protein